MNSVRTSFVQMTRLDPLMLSLFPFVTLAQATPAPLFPPPTKVPAQELVIPREALPAQETLQIQEIFQPQEVRPLPGQLDTVPVLNSNSPEVVQSEGILISTFPPIGKDVPSAHLNYAFQGRFDIFSHHIARVSSGQPRTLFHGILLNNPTSQPVKVEVLQGASYTTRPDALFISLPSYVEDPQGRVYAGPGSRVVNDLLRGRRQGFLPREIILQPGENQMLINLPIPVAGAPGSNGRSTLLRLRSTGSVYAASLAMYAPIKDGRERPPTLEEWQTLLFKSGLAGPRDIPPTPPGSNVVRVFYGRVAGVAVGSQWEAKLTDNPKSEVLTIPKRGRAFSYGLSTLYRGTLGTGQIQSAKLLARYPDTAYQAHGNYGIQYSLSLPLHNPAKQPQTVTLAIQTPLKDDRNKGGLLFYNPPENRVFFRGPVRIRYTDDNGSTQTRFVHVTQHRGQQGEPLLTLTLPAGAHRLVQVDLLYPPDSTPPQVLTVQTLDQTVGVTASPTNTSSSP
ncbi:Protein of unknown function (DUF3370) [Leptolyngbyaceae cyanobacterium JSC-12]|nr:Protein of unknown function (DUF3370) [Leptolyngbyaceae cyanobacterium JSC-12]